MDKIPTPEQMTFRKKITYSFIIALFTFGIARVGYFQGAELFRGNVFQIIIGLVFLSIISIVGLVFDPEQGGMVHDVWKLYASLFITFIIVFAIFVLVDWRRQKFSSKNQDHLI